jgi:uncharacterized membrane protein YjjB (DUF3815 family)
VIRFLTWLTTPKRPVWLYMGFVVIFVIAGMLATERFWYGDTIASVVAALVIGFLAAVVSGYLVERMTR